MATENEIANKKNKTKKPKKHFFYALKLNCGELIGQQLSNKIERKWNSQDKFSYSASFRHLRTCWFGVAQLFVRSVHAQQINNDVARQGLWWYKPEFNVGLRTDTGLGGGRTEWWVPQTQLIVCDKNQPFPWYFNIQSTLTIKFIKSQIQTQTLQNIYCLWIT